MTEGNGNHGIRLRQAAVLRRIGSAELEAIPDIRQKNDFAGQAGGVLREAMNTPGRR
jgi:hypothetical protein